MFLSQIDHRISRTTPCKFSEPPSIIHTPENYNFFKRRVNFRIKSPQKPHSPYQDHLTMTVTKSEMRQANSDTPPTLIKK